MVRGEKIILSLGVLFILIGLIANEWLIAKLFASGGIMSFSNRAVIWLFDLFFFFFGLALIWRRRKIELCSRLLLVFFSIVFCLFAAEIFLRVLEKKSQNTTIFSSEYHHDVRPNQAYTFYPQKDDEFGPVENVINSFGIRGPEIPEKQTGEYRVVLLGDSFVESEQIEYQKTAGELLNQILAEKKVKVIQKGVGSWSPLLEMNWLVKKGLSLKPDSVILFLCVNDFYGSYDMSDKAYTEEAEFDSQGMPVSFQLQREQFRPKLLELASRVISNFLTKKPNYTQEQINYLLSIDSFQLDAALNDIIPAAAENDTIVKDIIRLTRPVELWDKGTADTVSLSFKYLNEIKKIAKENNISLVITFLPLGWNISQNENFIGRKYYGFGNAVIPMGGIADRIKEYCADNNIDYLDLYADFKNFNEKNSQEKLFLINNGHWSEQGQVVVAESIEKYLRAKSIIND